MFESDLRPALRELLRRSSSTIRPLGSEQDVAFGIIRMYLSPDEAVAYLHGRIEACYAVARSVHPSTVFAL